DRMAQMIRVGFVNARMPEKMRVKVTIPDTVGAPLITDFLPVLCPRACEDMQYDLPDIGDQVLCLFLSYGLEQGFVVGSMYGKQTPPAQSGDKWRRVFKDGTFLEYDRAAHKLVANVQGDIEVTATGKLTANVTGSASIASNDRLSLDAPSMSMGGGGGATTSASMEGTFDLTKGDILAQGISLLRHVHTCPACGAQTSPPVGTGGGTGGASGSGGGQNSNNSGGSDSGSGTGDNSGSGNAPGLELSPAFASALAATGFVWTAEAKAQFEETKKKARLYAYEEFEDPSKKEEQSHNIEAFDTILCLPRIAEAEAMAANDADRLGWLYLKQMFEKWLSGRANNDPFKNKEPFWVSLYWVLHYKRAFAMWLYIMTKIGLFIEDSKRLLFERIKSENLVTDKEEYFNFTQSNWPKWNDHYFRSVRVPGMDSFPPDGLMAAMGDFNFRALADGAIAPSENGYKIKVNKVCVFVWDSFNFAGDFPLLYWSCVNERFQILDPDEAVFLSNADFRKFQDETDGGDEFLVLSEPKNIDNFGIYEYEIIL
ncbi:MAG: phage baseplate assembly protein V, partial [Desulfovibrio sp.]|nr:phage baseplate assembly protein V [Desulfovibrio sp.]